jgi:hypothetical protein
MGGKNPEICPETKQKGKNPEVSPETIYRGKNLGSVLKQYIGEKKSLNQS